MQDSLFNPNSNQCIISYELLSLLRWIIEHDAEKLKKLVNKALASGLKDELRNVEIMADANSQDPNFAAEVQHSIIEFFALLETLLLESINEHAVQRVVEKNLMPAIDQIDSTAMDDDTLRFSVEKASAKFQDATRENAQELLFKELLRRWKPSKKSLLN